MKIHSIQFPGYMERCSGFTIPENGVFYALYFDVNLAHFDITSDKAEIIEDDWKVDDGLSLIQLNGTRHPFVGYSGTNALIHKNDLGDLSLRNSRVILTRPDGLVSEWEFENFSGDWERINFDVARDVFLFGAPYDFDLKYVEITEQSPVDDILRATIE